MNAGPDIERLIASWLTEESPGRAPDRILDAAARRIDRTHQRRFVVAWREPMYGTLRGVLAAAAVGVVFIGGALFVMRGSPSSGVGGNPSATPPPTSASPSPSASGPITACGLFSPDEVASAVGDPGLGALPSASGTGSETTCLYSDGGGNVVLRVTFTNPGGRLAFETAQGVAGVESATIPGTDAVFDPALATLYVAKGDALVTLKAGTSSQSSGQRLALETSLARLLDARL